MYEALVSVVITTYNRSDFLEQTINSLENQTYSNVEIILIDDGSDLLISNLNKSICSRYNKCKYYWKKNTGQPDSRNYGIKLAQGEFIGFCDDDDYWVLDKLEKQVFILLHNEEFDIITGDIGFVDEFGNTIDKIKSHRGFNHGYIFENLLLKNRTSSVTPLLRRQVFEKTGLFNPKFTIAEDWDFWRRASYYHKFYSQNEIMAYVRIHDKKMTFKRQNICARVMLFRKLSDELIKWGKNRFNNRDRNLIFYYERLTYQRIISNNFDTKLKQLAFILKIFINDPLNAFHIIKLFLMKIDK